MRVRARVWVCVCIAIAFKHGKFAGMAKRSGTNIHTQFFVFFYFFVFSHFCCCSIRIFLWEIIWKIYHRCSGTEQNEWFHKIELCAYYISDGKWYARCDIFAMLFFLPILSIHRKRIIQRLVSFNFFSSNFCFFFYKNLSTRKQHSNIGNRNRFDHCDGNALLFTNTQRAQ